MPDGVPNVARPRLEVRHEDMEVETENGPTPVGAGSEEVGLSMDTEGSGVKREAEQSVEIWKMKWLQNVQLVELKFQ